MQIHSAEGQMMQTHGNKQQKKCGVREHIGQCSRIAQKYLGTVANGSLLIPRQTEMKAIKRQLLVYQDFDYTLTSIYIHEILYSHRNDHGQLRNIPPK